MSAVATSAAVNAAAVKKHFQSHQRRARAVKSGAVLRREKGFIPGGGGPGASGADSVAVASAAKAGAELFADESDALISSASGFAKSAGTSGRDKSCFLLRCRKSIHEKSLGSSAKEPLQNCHSTLLDEALNYRKNLYIVRHEQGLPRRRAVDPYLQLTGAQVDLHSVIPGGQFAQQQGGWMIHNTQRQQLTHDGVPLMTRVMRGEYYAAENPPKPPRNDFRERNRVHVRAASAASRVFRDASKNSHCCIRGSA